MVTISLPVKIFEAQTMLERLADLFRLAPLLISAAQTFGDPWERFKYVVAFGVGILHFSPSQFKPFVPMLGETFQGKIKGECNLYFEQISVMPPITLFHIESMDNMWELYGHFKFHAGIIGNYISILFQGPITVHFKDSGQKVKFRFPELVINGVITGNRSIVYDGPMMFFDEVNRKKAVLFFTGMKEKGKFISKRVINDICDKITGMLYEPKKESSTFFSKLLGCCSSGSSLPRSIKDIHDIK
jgi:hypothetical protein